VSSAAPVVVVGLGSIGRRHLENLRGLGVSDVTLLRTGHGGRIDDRFRHLPVDVELTAALARRPRAVIVANPTALHLPVSLAAARAGCALLIEKPVSHSLEGIAELQDAVRAAGAACVVGFQYRFHDGLRQIRSWIDEGVLGRPISAGVEWGEFLPDWHPHEDYRRGYSARRDLGGGAVLTLCHPFDTLRFLLGEVSAVSAEVARVSGLELDVEDLAHVTLRFSSGAVGSVALDYVQRPRRHVLRIVGTEGVACWDEADGAARLARPGRQELVRPPRPGFARNTMFVDELRHFLDCTDGRAEPVSGLQDGVRSLAIALAALESARNGRRIDV
jgi:predicted dehydrogenase